MGRLSGTQTAPSVDLEAVAACLAKAVAAGDTVNFRFLFSPHSPARSLSPEDIQAEKYAYLQPDSAMEQTGGYQEALACVKAAPVWEHIQLELEANRPAQVPFEPLIALADNAVRLGKYASAAQAYEQLRIRRRMQEEFYTQAEKALDAGDTASAVRGYLIATGLEYDYGAFPEPLPSTPNFQTKALLLHAEYPMHPRDSVSLLEAEPLVDTALSYLLLNLDAAKRLKTRTLSVRLDFIKELVAQRDPHWNEFVDRYRKACDMAMAYNQNAQSVLDKSSEESLEQEIEAELGADPRLISAAMLGRVVPDGAWWQYLKELAYEHPASTLFIARQMVGDYEIILPRQPAKSVLGKHLNLEPPKGGEGGM